MIIGGGYIVKNAFRHETARCIASAVLLRLLPPRFAVQAIELHPLSVDERAELIAARGTRPAGAAHAAGALPNATPMVSRIASLDPQGRIAESSIVTALG